MIVSKLNEAASHDIPVEIIRAKAPGALALSGAEFCSLIMNLMDNAEDASAPGIERRYIKLDMHINNNFFVFICENVTAVKMSPRRSGKKRESPGKGPGAQYHTPGHGAL